MIALDTKCQNPPVEPANRVQMQNSELIILITLSSLLLVVGLIFTITYCCHHIQSQHKSFGNQVKEEDPSVLPEAPANNEMPQELLKVKKTLKNKDKISLKL